MLRRRHKKHKLSVKSWSLKILVNVWSFITIIMFGADFFSGNQFDSQAGGIGVIYLAILGIYAGEKEFTRWHNDFVSQFVGESFIVIWTAVMITFVVLAPLSGGLFRVPAEFALVYTSVVGIFAVTQHSKLMRSRR